jgi:hypothetical protein
MICVLLCVNFDMDPSHFTTSHSQLALAPTCHVFGLFKYQNYSRPLSGNTKDMPP